MNNRPSVALPLLILCWLVSAETIRVVDGDTFVAKMEIWPKLFKVETVRVLGVNTPEMRGPDKDRAALAKRFTSEWLDRGAYQIEACGRDHFGRLLGKAFRSDSVLSDELIAQELGRRR